MSDVAGRAPEGLRASHVPEDSGPEEPGFEALDDGEEVAVNARKRAWARLLAKVYESDPLVCPKCGSEYDVQFRGRGTAEVRQSRTAVICGHPGSSCHTRHPRSPVEDRPCASRIRSNAAELRDSDSDSDLTYRLGQKRSDPDG